MSKYLLKKGQSSIVEIVFVMVFISVIITVIFSMISTISESEGQIGSDEDISRRTVQIARNMMSLPFVKCADDITSTDFCIDLYRVRAMLETEAELDVLEGSLFPIFGSTMIRAWFVEDPSNKIVLYNESPESYTIRRSKAYPVTIYDATSEEHRFGLLEVRLYR